MRGSSPFSSTQAGGLSHSLDDNKVVSVSELNRTISAALEQTFTLLWVAGEVSNFTCATSGHWYFSIKDAQAQIRCVMFRRRTQSAEFIPREGDKIEVCGLVTLYEPRGELQLSVEAVRRTGLGRLYEAFLRLKGQLEAEGLFAAHRKRALPAFPHTIGVVTSLQAAALHDVLVTLARRAPHIPVIVYPAPVQGADAAGKMVEMIETANYRHEVQVLIICRGGGSIADLWAFNEAILARAIAASTLPIVSGVGHETDATIADFAADARAPTPTGAAELASPQRAVMLHALKQCKATLKRGFRRHMERCMQQLDGLAYRLVRPAKRLQQQYAYLDQLRARLTSAGTRFVRDAQARFTSAQLRWRRGGPNCVVQRQALNIRAQQLRLVFARYSERQRAQMNVLSARLETLNPKRTLERGYVALFNAQTGDVVRTPQALQPKEQFTAYFAQGIADIVLAEVVVTSANTD